MKIKKKGKIALLGAVGAFSALLFSGGAVSASAEELCAHDYTPTTHLATCTKQGYTEYECSLCGDSYKDSFIDPSGHTYTEVVVEATCTAQGFTTHYCTICGYQYTDGFTEATGHSYMETLFEPTCVEQGYTLYACTECKTSYKDNVIDRLGHDYTEDVVEATCLEGGYTTFTCNRCEETHVGNEVAALGHSYIVIERVATCTAYGFTEHTCSVCSDRFVDGYQRPLEHSYKQEIVPATGTQLGYTKNTCEVCSYTYLSDFSESGEGGYIPKPEEPEEPEPPAPHVHSYTAEVTVSRLEKKVTLTVVCECGERAEDKVTVVFVDGAGEITSFTPTDGVVEYRELTGENYEVNVLDEQGNILKMFMLGEGAVEQPPEDTPDVPDNPEHTHSFLLQSTLDETQKLLVAYFYCECGEVTMEGLQVRFIEESGVEEEYPLNEWGELSYADIADGEYTVQVEQNGEVLNVFLVTVGEASTEIPDIPDEGETPDEGEQPDEPNFGEDEDIPFAPSTDEEGNDEEQAEEKGGNLGLILGCIIFVLVVAGGIVTVIILKKKNKK